MHDKKLLLFIIASCIVNIVNSQSNSNGDSIASIIKMSIYSEMKLGITSKRVLKNYIAKDLKIKKINSKGFTDIEFYTIQPQVLSADTMRGGNIRKYVTPACFLPGDSCDLVVGVNTYNGTVYKLRGFNENDFRKLYLSQTYWYNWKRIKKLKKSDISNYVVDFKIEGIDLECLMSTLIKGNCNYSCLKSVFYQSGHK